MTYYNHRPFFLSVDCKGRPGKRSPRGGIEVQIHRDTKTTGYKTKPWAEELCWRHVFKTMMSLQL